MNQALHDKIMKDYYNATLLCIAEGWIDASKEIKKYLEEEKRVKKNHS